MFQAHVGDTLMGITDPTIEQSKNSRQKTCLDQTWLVNTSYNFPMDDTSIKHYIELAVGSLTIYAKLKDSLLTSALSDQ